MVENPRAIVAVPDFVSQPSASKSLNVPKEVPKESKVQSFCFIYCDPYKSSTKNTLSFLYCSMTSLLRSMQTRTLNTKTLPKSVNDMQKNKPPESKPLNFLLLPVCAKPCHSLTTKKLFSFLFNRLSRKAEIEKMEVEIRKLQRRRGDDSDNEDEALKKKVKKSYLNEELDKYAKGRGLHKKGKKKDEGDVLAALNSFRGKLQSSIIVDEPEHNADAIAAGAGGGGDATLEDGEEMEVDNDTGFMSHALHFPKDNGEETIKAERDYEVIDPRERGAKAKEEERERKRAALKAKGGHVSGGRYRR